MASNQINTAWFKDRLIAKEISQRTLSKRLGMDPAALSLALRGRRKLQLAEAERLAQELSVPLAEVLEAAGINPATGSHDMATVAGHVAADGAVAMGKADGPRRVPTPAGMPSNTQAVRYQCDGTRDGWLAFYVPNDQVDPYCMGRLAMVRLEGKGGAFLRVLRRGYSKGTWNLADLFGGAIVEGVRVASATPVLWIKTS